MTKKVSKTKPTIHTGSSPKDVYMTMVTTMIDNDNDKESMKNKADQHWGAPHTAADTQRLAPAPPQRGDQARPDHTQALFIIMFDMGFRAQ